MYITFRYYLKDEIVIEEELANLLKEKGKLSLGPLDGLVAEREGGGAVSLPDYGSTGFLHKLKELEEKQIVRGAAKLFRGYVGGEYHHWISPY